MDSEAPPKLQHDLPPPESFLPGTPDWYWWLVATGGALVLLLLAWLFQLLKPKTRKLRPLERDLFGPALKALDEFEEMVDRKLLSEIAAGISLTIRTYLADAQSEPALYETVEEFEARQSILPPETNRLLNELNEAKYAKSQVKADQGREFVERARQELKFLHARPAPEDEKAVVVKSKSDLRKTASHVSIVLVPVALIGAITSFLLGIYDGPDTGSDLNVPLLTWISLGVAAPALLVHLVTRRPS